MNTHKYNYHTTW